MEVEEKLCEFRREETQVRWKLKRSIMSSEERKRDVSDIEVEENQCKI